MWWPRIALTLSILAAALLVFSGLGVRAGLWPLRVGFGMFAGALLTGMAAIGAASIALAVPRLRHPKRMLVAALLLGAASAAMPLEHLRRVKTLPYINDITTDTEEPPQFSQPKPYERHFAELQQLGYPGLQPLRLALPPAQAFKRALAAAHAMGLEVLAADENAGRIEAVATTRWFGFKDDVVVRIAPAGAGSRIDVRSKSRMGRSDVGANAARIQEFLTRVGSERGATYHPRGNDHRIHAHAARGLPARRADAGIRAAPARRDRADEIGVGGVRAPRPAARADRGNRGDAAHGHHGFVRHRRARRQHARRRIACLLLLRLSARRHVAVFQGRGAEPRRAGGIFRRSRRGTALARGGAAVTLGFAALGKKGYSSGIVSGKQGSSMKQIAFLVLALFAATAVAQEKPPAKEEATKPEAVKEAAKPAPTKSAAKKSPRRWNEDARHCLERTSNTEVIKCAEEYL